MPITQYTGKTLLKRDVVSAIQREAELLVRDKNVAGAYQASLHLKKEISSLPQEEVSPVLDAYRRIATKLKALAVPLLDLEDVEHLLRNNLDFLDTESEKYLVQGLSAFIASGPDEKIEELKARLKTSVDKDSLVAPKIFSVLRANSPEIRRSPPDAPKETDEILDADESDDLAKSAQKAHGIVAGLSIDALVQTIARQIFSQSGSKAAEEDFVRRAQALAKSRLRDIRTSAEISEYLSRPFNAGGLSLSGEALSQAQRIIEAEYKRLHFGKKESPPAPDARERRVDEKIIAQAAPKEAVLEKRADSRATSVQQKDSQERAQEELDKLIKSGAQEQAGIESILSGRMSANKPSENRTLSPRKDNLSARPASRQSKLTMPGKVRLDDVRTSEPGQSAKPGGFSPSVKSMGLADELTQINISDLRSQSSLKSSIGRILEDIEALERDSIIQKIAGIKNFRTSPLYRKYIEIGEASLEQGRKLSDALSDESINPDKITEDEFFAISDLNSKLR